MLSEKIDVLYDDRGDKAGSQFSDADLFGIPFRVVVAPKSLAEGKVEVRSRDKSWSDKIPVDKVIPVLKQQIAAEYLKFK
jgi:prolyl-tRNA synthetase